MNWVIEKQSCVRQQVNGKRHWRNIIFACSINIIRNNAGWLVASYTGVKRISWLLAVEWASPDAEVQWVVVQAGHTLDVLVDVGVAGGRAGAGGGGGVAAVGILLVSIVSILWAMGGWLRGRYSWCVCVLTVGKADNCRGVITIAHCPVMTVIVPPVPTLPTLLTTHPALRLSPTSHASTGSWTRMKADIGTPSFGNWFDRIIRQVYMDCLAEKT